MRNDHGPVQFPGQAERPPGSAKEIAAGRAVLVVDDDVLVREVVQSALEDDGYAVVAVGNGRAAVLVLEERSAEYRLLLTDVALGQGPSGWDVAKRGRKIYPDLAVVYMSGADLHDYAARGVPNSAVISKPFSIAEIMVEVSALMQA